MAEGDFHFLYKNLIVPLSCWAKVQPLVVASLALALDHSWVRLGLCWVVVVHTFSPSIQEAEEGDLCEFEAILVYRASSSTAKDTERNPVLNNKKQTNKYNKENWICSKVLLVHTRIAVVDFGGRATI